MTTRQPIITVLGHVDHGKTSLLDYIRGTAVADREAGLITQHVGASSVPLDVIKKQCGQLLEQFKIKFTIPGLLFIDTPGHEVFTNLRKRGGSAADLAIVVIDIMQGIQPQTREAIEILKTFKVPFVVAANKIDLIQGWKSNSQVFVQNFEKQNSTTKEIFDKKFYTLVGQLSEAGFDSDLYTKVDDYRKKVSIVPVSARTGEGIAELLALLTGLAQKFLEKNLDINPACSAKGTILEIKEEVGLGMTADAIVYDGCIKVGDTIVVGGISGIVKTKVKALLRPLPLVEMRDARRRFEPVKEVFAASGVKIVAPELDKVFAGTPLLSGKTDAEIKAAEESVLEEIESIVLQTDDTGIILKTDTLGSLEAVASILRKKNICIKKLGIGPVSRADVMAAAAAACSAPLETFVLGFNIKAEDDTVAAAEKQGVTVITDKVIYHLIERFEEELAKKRSELEKKALEGITWPGKFTILKGFIFRASHPAVFGVEVLGGRIKPKEPIMNKDGKELGEIKEIEDGGQKKDILNAGEKAAVSVEGITVGRQVKEGDILYISMDECNFRALKAKKELLSGQDIAILKEIAEIKRKSKETWGV